MPIGIFEAAAKKRKGLLAIYETLPETTIYGVVGANGPSGSKVGQETQWNLGFDLIAWRLPEAPVKRTPLRVEKLVSEAELSVLRGAIHAESIIALRGKLCEGSPFGDTRFLLVGLLERPVDEDLELALSESRKSVEMFDPVIGKLVLNKKVNWFEGEVIWLGKQIDISISVDQSGTPAYSLSTAKALLEDMERWAAQVNDYAVAKLLDLKNENWLNDRQSSLTRKEFIDRMRLRSITAFPGGEFSFWHDDGGLFWGHSIQVSGSIDKGLTHADIPG